MKTITKTLGQLAGTVLISGDEKTMITGLSCNSRTVETGYLFAALPGTTVDGAKFIDNALENGAAAILLHEDVARDHINVPCIVSADPRKDTAFVAAQFFEQQPAHIVAVTGTNGKTSVVSFVQQVWQAMGIKGASLGTVGIQAGDQYWPLSHTTPDPIELHEKLAILVDEGITHLAIEASSHGLEQRRLEAVNIDVAAFTNITQDHLDYHGSMEEYFAQKLRLFSELLPDGASVVVDADIAGSSDVIDIAKQRGFKVLSVGHKGETLKLIKLGLTGYGQELLIKAGDENETKINSDLIGDFQASNLLVAAGLCIAVGANWREISRALGGLQGAKGRMEIVGETALGVPVIVDYAHTPDALKNAMLALKPISKGGRIHVVFGCGGDRDKGKRPLMGAIAQKHADIVYVTDDNPRSEDPASIRTEILAAAPDAIEIGDRQSAINEAVRHLQAGDILLVAGKGHEEGQKVGHEVLPFLDHTAVAKALALLDGENIT
ncbi:MAG: UDP-N-acetylmuramoyl-L-alanyl-D-glutamate--2,6-diaminopimelate ligase [bacterium]|nr:UDP-N-acetylmuramoyl-L-alanyl-D-glutamate--2,6-diaminopimelate ligase [bacterium]